MNLQVEEAELARLAEAVKRSEGSYFAFVMYAILSSREDLLARLKARVPGVSWRRIPLEGGGVRLEAAPALGRPATKPVLSTAEGKQQSKTRLGEKTAYLLYGLDEMTQAELTVTLEALNWSRERLGALRSPVLLLAPEGVMAELARRAPDLWSWRSGIYSLAPAPALSPTLAQPILAGLGQEHYRLSYDELSKRERLYRDIIGQEEASEAPNRGLLARLYSQVGEIRWRLGYLEEALAWFQRALPIREEVGDRRGLATTLNNIGMVYQNRGMLEEALSWFQRALPIFEELGDRRGLAATLINIGMVYQDRGMLEEALVWHQRALPIFEEVGDRRGLATTLNNIGTVYQDRGMLEEALAWHQRALPIFEEVGDRRGLATTLNNIGTVYQDRGMLEEALKYRLRAVTIKRETGQPLDPVEQELLKAAQQRACLPQAGGKGSEKAADPGGTGGQIG